MSKFLAAIIILAMMSTAADAGCFLFFCSHHRVRAHMHQPRHVVVRTRIHTVTVVKTKTVVVPVHKETLPPIAPIK